MALLPVLSETPLERGQVLFEPHDPVEAVYFPSSAVLSVVAVMRNGNAVETSSVGCESATPLLQALSKLPVNSRIFAQVGGAAMRLPASVLRQRSEESPELRRLLLRHAGLIARQAEQGVACNALHQASARLARWLLMTQDRTGDRTLPLTQDYLAIMTGVQRTTISAIASQLRAAGLIRFSRGRLGILDRDGLEAAACECYGVMRGAFEALQQPA
ncbi:MAG: Crp/Fnr family transcriptional regulator [Phenylobacterium sp.]